MKKKVTEPLLFATLLCFYVNNASAEEIKPTVSRYIFSKEPDRETDECGITLLVSSYPSPEYASARVQAIHGVRGGKVGHDAWGLTFSTYDATYANGVVKKFTVIPLAYASLSGPDFSSEGRMSGGPMQDGTVFLFSPSDVVTSAMARSFTHGDVRISFTRVGSTTVRSYTIAEPPPVPVLQQFIACTQKMFKLP